MNNKRIVICGCDFEETYKIAEIIAKKTKGYKIDFVSNNYDWEDAFWGKIEMKAVIVNEDTYWIYSKEKEGDSITNLPVLVVTTQKIMYIEDDSLEGFTNNKLVKNKCKEFNIPYIEIECNIRRDENKKLIINVNFVDFKLKLYRVIKNLKLKKRSWLNTVCKNSIIKYEESPCDLKFDGKFYVKVGLTEKIREIECLIYYKIIDKIILLCGELTNLELWGGSIPATDDLTKLKEHQYHNIFQSAIKRFNITNPEIKKFVINPNIMEHIS
jgi:hypothetical protein